MIPDLAQVLARFRLRDPEQIALTATSTVWKVRLPGAGTAVLKLLHPGEAEERTGFSYLQALAGRGAVQVLAREGAAILMEHCPGPSLGDLAREGRDDAATEALCDVIQALQAACPDPSGYQSLAARFLPLTAPALDGDIARAALIAQALLAEPGPTVALHGDLHHDNVLSSPRGWLAIDPKGLSGDPAYEPANAFRNPEGLGDRLFDPDRIRDMTNHFARRLGHSPRRLLGWAAAHCALSTRWSLEAGRDITQDLRLLPILLDAHAHF